MKEISIEELLKLQIEILQKVDNFCRQNNIPYTVFGGTAIGTIRHQGYIPWDDDIDIAMTRPNYERFIRLFNGAYEELRVCAPELNWKYYAPYANVYDNRTLLKEDGNGHNGMDIGVKIDVFPIDAVPSDDAEYQNLKRLVHKYWFILYAKRISLILMWKRNKKSAIYYFLIRLKYFFQTYASIQKKMHYIITKYNYESSKYVDLVCYPWPTLSRCHRVAFESYMNIAFEYITVSIIEKYDEYLTKAYGDYMQLPPVEKRKAHHHFKAYWK